MSVYTAAVNANKNASEKTIRKTIRQTCSNLHWQKARNITNSFTDIHDAHCLEFQREADGTTPFGDPSVDTAFDVTHIKLGILYLSAADHGRAVEK